MNAIWLCDGYTPAHPMERVLPDGSAQLIINLREDSTRVYDPHDAAGCRRMRGSVVSGPRSEFTVIDTAEQACVVGVHFKPGGAAPFLGLPACELRNAFASLEELWGAAGADLRGRLLEARSPEERLRIVEGALMARAQGSPQPHPAVEFALREFQANPVAAAISEVSGRTGLSRRRFIRMFDDQVGLTPKLFCRVRRFHQAVRLVARGGPIRWAQLSLDCGYFDQAHFIRDFTEFCGFSPSAYLGSRTGHLNHVRAAG